MQPLVKPGTGHFQYSAHQHERKFLPVLVHEPVLNPGSLAKYRAAYLAGRAPLPAGASGNAAAGSRFLLRPARRFAFVFYRHDGLDPRLQTMGRYPQPRRDLRDRAASLVHLPNCFFFEFWRVTLCAHSYLLFANARSEMSTGVWEVHIDSGRALVRHDRW